MNRMEIVIGDAAMRFSRVTQVVININNVSIKIHVKKGGGVDQFKDYIMQEPKVTIINPGGQHALSAIQKAAEVQRTSDAPDAPLRLRLTDKITMMETPKQYNSNVVKRKRKKAKTLNESHVDESLSSAV